MAFGGRRTDHRVSALSLVNAWSSASTARAAHWARSRLLAACRDTPGRSWRLVSRCTVAVLSGPLVRGPPGYRLDVRYLSMAVRVVVGVFAVLILAMAATALPYALRAARGDGTHGSFTAERQECSKRSCSHYGTWRADPPGDVVVSNVLMDEWPSGLPLGESVDALYLGEADPAVVYPADGSLAWLHILVLAGAAVLLLWGTKAAIDEVREGRRLAQRSVGYEPQRVKHELDP